MTTTDTTTIHTRSDQILTRVDDPAASDPMAGIVTKITALLDEAQSLIDGAGDDDLDGEAKTRFDQISTELDGLQTRKKRLEVLHRHATSAGAASLESGGPTPAPTVPHQTRQSDPFDLNDPVIPGAEIRTRAITAVEQTRAMDDAAKERAVEVLEQRDSADGTIARRYVLTGHPLYRTAFMKMAAGAHVEVTPEEAAVVRQVRAASLTDTAGGFAVPAPIDPTLILTNGGTNNPFREISRVIPISNDEWKGVSTAGVSARWAAEGTEANDDSPTLAQPTIKAEKADTFVQFSVELGGDWASLERDLTMAMADEKDNLEALAFTKGAGPGSGQPTGIVTALAAAGGGVASVITDATGYDWANLPFVLQASTPPRHRRKNVSTFVGSLEYINKLRGLRDSNGGFVFPYVANDDGIPVIAGRPFHEVSDMDAHTVEDGWFTIHGNFQRYVIVDRVGMSVELVQHIVGDNGRPTGERGLYAFWRTGAGCVDSNAFRMMGLNESA